MNVAEIALALRKAKACPEGIAWVRRQAKRQPSDIIAGIRPDWATWVLRRLPPDMVRTWRTSLIEAVTINTKWSERLLRNPGVAGPLWPAERAKLLKSSCQSIYSAARLLRDPGSAGPWTPAEHAALEAAAEPAI